MSSWTCATFRKPRPDKPGGRSLPTASPSAALGVLDTDANLVLLDVEPHVRHPPRGSQAKNLLIDVRVDHARPQREGYILPPELPKES